MGDRPVRFAERASVVVVIVTSLVLSLTAACGDGDGSSGSDGRPTFAFSDAKGRQCTQTKFGLVATCTATATPKNPCTAGNHACFVVYAGNVQAGAASAIGPPPLWNCDACCADVGGAYTGVSDDCSSYTCKSAADCAGEDGTCDNGQCHAGQ